MDPETIISTIANFVFLTLIVALASIIIGIIGILTIANARRHIRRYQIRVQQRYVDAWEDAEELHPGLYTADLRRERKKLEQLRS